jgi:plasmid stabilization system protein ParE
MKVEYSKPAVVELKRIATESREFGAVVADAVEARINDAIAQIAWDPNSAPEVTERLGVHVVHLVRFPFAIFYRVLEDRVRILRVRHTARRPWDGQ